MNRFRRVWQRRQKDTAFPGAGNVKRLGEDGDQTVGPKMQVAHSQEWTYLLPNKVSPYFDRSPVSSAGSVQRAIRIAVAASSCAWPERRTGVTGKASCSNRFIA